MRVHFVGVIQVLIECPRLHIFPSMLVESIWNPKISISLLLGYEITLCSIMRLGRILVPLGCRYVLCDLFPQKWGTAFTHGLSKGLLVVDFKDPPSLLEFNLLVMIAHILAVKSLYVHDNPSPTAALSLWLHAWLSLGSIFILYLLFLGLPKLCNLCSRR